MGARRVLVTGAEGTIGTAVRQDDDVVFLGAHGLACALHLAEGVSASCSSRAETTFLNRG